MDRKRPHYFRERGEVRRGGIRSPATTRGSGQETGDSGEAFRRTEVLGRPARDPQNSAGAGHGARARQPAPLAARMMGPRLGPGSATLRRARWTQRRSAPPCGRRCTVVTGRLSSSCSAGLAPTMIRCSWLATASSRPSCSAWREPPSWLANSGSGCGSETGTGMMSWPSSLRLSSAADQRRCCAPCPSTSRSWPASSKATPQRRGPHRYQDR